MQCVRWVVQCTTAPRLPVMETAGEGSGVGGGRPAPAAARRHRLGKSCEAYWFQYLECIFWYFFFGIKQGYLCGRTKAALTWHHSWHSLAVRFLATCDTNILSLTVPLMCGEPVSMLGRSTCTGVQLARPKKGGSFLALPAKLMTCLLWRLCANRQGVALANGQLSAAGSGLVLGQLGCCVEALSVVI